MDTLEVAKYIADVATPLVFGAASIYFARKALVFDREQIQAAREADICAWSEKCLSALVDAEGLSELSDQTKDLEDWLFRKSDVLGNLSALTDYGRLYFPNRVEGEFGLRKESAFQGIRDPILDCLVGAHRLVLPLKFNAGQGKETRSQLVKYRRDFISRVQERINPRRRIGFISREANGKTAGETK